MVLIIKIGSFNGIELGFHEILDLKGWTLGSWTTAYRRPWVLGGFWGADHVLGCPPYKIFSWTCCYAIHSSLAPYPGTRYQVLLVTCKTLLIFALLFLGGVLGGADNVLGCPPYKIFSWTCCYAIHSSLAPYPGTRYQLLLVTCKTLLIFALLFLGGGFGGADNVLGCPPYKIFSWTCCYAIHSSLAPYPGTRYQLLLVTCKTLLIFALLFLGGGVWGGFGGGLITFLAARLTRYSLGLAATLKREMAITK